MPGVSLFRLKSSVLANVSRWTLCDTRPPPGHTTSDTVRTGEGNHEMPGLPYPAFRRVDAEPGGGKPSPYTWRNSITK